MSRRATRPPRGGALYGTTDLPVLLPPAARLAAQARAERLLGAPRLRLRAWHGAALALLVLGWSGLVWAQDAGGTAEPGGVLAALWRWTPVLLGGFVFNIAISFLSMGIGTLLGTLLGLMQISLLAPLRGGSWLVTQFFRNAPWLVLLFFCMFLLPFEFRIAGATIPFPDWIKAVIGLSLPVMANVSEIVRGAIQSIPTGQWEAARALAFNRRQILWQIILPQCVKRMLPPWMNLYAILTMATVLASVVGVGEVMTLTQRVLAAENRPEFLVPFYGAVMLLFFAYCY
ncbi:polar amino acid ABC transporter permease, partial [Phormidium willei BDU 130791]